MTLTNLDRRLLIVCTIAAAAVAYLAALLVGVAESVPPLLPLLGAVTLAQAATLSENDLQRGVIEEFVIQSVVLDRIPLKPISGNAYAYNKEAALPGVEFRAVNAAYSESTGTFAQATEGLVILGGDADVDTFIQQTRSDLNDQRASQDRMKIKAASFKFQDAFVNGDTAVDANSFDGLKKRLTGAQVLEAGGGANGIPVLGADSAARQTFFDELDRLLAAVPGLSSGNGVLYMNGVIRSKIISAMRRENLSLEGVGRLPSPLVQSAGNVPIAEAQLPTYNGIPMIDIGTKADGSQIVTATETQGASTDSSSIYAVKFGQDEGDQAVTGLTNGGVQVRDLGEIDAKPVLRTRIEFFCGLALFGGKAAARLRGARNA